MNSLLIVALITLTWSVNSGYGAEIVNSGNFFDRLNPIRSIVGAQSYDNAKLNAFTLPSRMIQGISNIAMAPWRGNDFSGRGGRMPNMSNLFSGLPIVGSVLGGSRGTRETGTANNYGPMAQVEMARAPGSVSGSASASASASGSVSGQNAGGRPSGSASVSASANGFGQPTNSMPGLSSLPNNFFASLPMPPAPGQGFRNQGSASSTSQSSRPSSPTTTSASSSSAGLPSIPSSSSSTLGSTSRGSSSTPQLPSLNLGPQSASTIPSGSGSASSSIDPTIAQALNGLGFNLNGLNLGGSFDGNSQTPSSGASASIGASGQPQASASASSGSSSPFASLMNGFNGQPTGQASALASSGLANGFNSLLSGGASSSTPGIGQASNFLSNLFNFPLTG